MKTISNIIKEVKNACEDNGLNVDDNTILDCSVRVFNAPANNNNTQKTNYMKKTQKSNSQASKPTDKQKYRLEQMGAKNIDQISRKEATRMIKEHFDNKQVNNDFAGK